MGALALLQTVYMKTVPFVTPPALKAGNNFAPDETTKATRVYAICMAGFSASVTALTVFRLSSLVYCVTILTTSVLAYLEAQRANLAADRNAVQEFKKEGAPPSHLATERIRASVKAAHLLLANTPELNRIDESGERLLQVGGNLEVFKLLLRGGANVKLGVVTSLSSLKSKQWEEFSERQGFGPVTHFHQAVAAEKVDYLRVIIEHISIKTSDFTPDQQYGFWAHVGTREAAGLLKRLGFDPNVVNSKGQKASDFATSMIAQTNPPVFNEGSLTWQERRAILVG